jgi:hypothetical protein
MLHSYVAQLVLEKAVLPVNRHSQKVIQVVCCKMCFFLHRWLLLEDRVVVPVSRNKLIQSNKFPIFKLSRRYVSI